MNTYDLSFYVQQSHDKVPVMFIAIIKSACAV
jgi:hypothetical protein